MYGKQNEENKTIQKKEKFHLKNPEMAYFIKVTSLMKMRGDVSTNIRKKNGDKINMDETEIVKC